MIKTTFLHIKSYIRTSEKHKLYVTAFFVLVLAVRIILFLGVNDIGVEHDSGWFTGVSRNLAESGAYASYTNLSNVIDDEIGRTMFNDFDIQDESGKVYFSHAVSVGPGYIIPTTLAIKAFGNGYWQYKLVPVVGYVLLLALLFTLLSYLQGYESQILLFIYLLNFPQILSNQSVEAFSEHWSLVYFLSSLILIFASHLYARNERSILTVSGIVFGIAVLTKTNISMFAPAVIMYIFILSFEKQNIVSSTLHFLRKLFSFCLGLFLPLLLFESYKYFYLKNYFSLESYFILYLQQSKRYYSLALSNWDWLAVAIRADFWKYVFEMNSLIVWVVFILIPFFIFWKLRTKSQKQLFLALYVASFTMLVWFVFFSPTGWLRHAWSAVMMSVAIVSLCGGYALTSFKKMAAFGIIPLASALLILSTFFSPVRSGFVPSAAAHNENWLKWADRTSGPIQGLFSHPFFSRRDQDEVVNYLHKNAQDYDHLYYVSSFYVAEIGFLSDKVMMPIQRFINLKERDGILIVGPYQRGALTRVDAENTDDFMNEICSRTLIENASYKLCKIEAAHLAKFISN